jgi:hypothetical protein
LAVFTYGFSTGKVFVPRAFGAFCGPWKMGLQMKDLPNQIIRRTRSPYTDKAQLRVGKYRNISRQVAIDQSGKID